MKRRKHGYLVLFLLILLLALGVIVGRNLLEQRRLRNAAGIHCPVFDTGTYLAGSELEGRDLTALLSGASSPVQDIPYGEARLGSVRFTELQADGFPSPYAVLLKTAVDEEPLFVRPEGLDIAETLSEAKTLIYVVQTGPFHSGSYYCQYRPYVFTLSGTYFLPCETALRLIAETVQEGLVKSVETFGTAAPGTENPLEAYVRNYERVLSFDFMRLMEDAVPAADEGAVEYRIRKAEDELDYEDWREIPWYDLTEGVWGSGEFELNGDPPLYLMTSEVTGKTPIQGSYAALGTAYIQTLNIRIYDCLSGVYVEFPWQDSTEARPQVSGGILASYPPPAYYRVK